MNAFRYCLLFFFQLAFSSGFGQNKIMLGYTHEDTLYIRRNPIIEFDKTTENSFVSYCLVKNYGNLPSIAKVDFLKGYNQCKTCQYKYNQKKYQERIYVIALNHSVNFLNMGKNKYMLSSYSTYYNNLYGSSGSLPWIKIPKIKALNRNVHINGRGAILISN